MHSPAADRTLRVLWGVDSPSGRGPKPRWSLPEIQEAAVALADSKGLGGVTLANLARELGLTTTALYRYVDSKDTLERLMVDAALGEPPPLRSEHWQDRCREWSVNLRARYDEHPWLADLHPSGMPQLPNPLRWIDTLVIAVAEVSDVDGMRLALLLEALVRNYAAMPRGDALGGRPDGWFAEAVMTKFPWLGDPGDRDFSDPEQELHYAVDLVLLGLSALQHHWPGEAVGPTHGVRLGR